MLDSEESQSESLYPTEFDLARLESLEVGETLFGELGNWSVMRYKHEYVLLLNNSKTFNSYMEFGSLEKLLYFLKKN